MDSANSCVHSQIYEFAHLIFSVKNSFSPLLRVSADIMYHVVQRKLAGGLSQP